MEIHGEERHNLFQKPSNQRILSPAQLLDWRSYFHTALNLQTALHNWK